MKRHAKVTILTLVAVALAGCTQSDKAAIQAMRFDSPKWKSGTAPDADANKAPVGTPQILPKTHLAAARLLEEQGMIHDAIVQYKKAIVLNHNYVEAYHHFGVLLLRIGKRIDGVNMLRRAVELRPDDALLRNNLGFALMLMERWDQAAEQLVRATQLHPYFARAQVNLGMTYARLGRFDDALASFETVLPSADAHYNLGLMYRGQRRYIAAADEFNKVLAINANFDAAYEQLQQIAPQLPPKPEPRAVAIADGGDSTAARTSTPGSKRPAPEGPTVKGPREHFSASPRPVTTGKQKQKPAENQRVIAPPQIDVTSMRDDESPCEEEDEWFAMDVADDEPIASDEIDMMVCEADDVVPVRIVATPTTRSTTRQRPTKAEHVTTPANAAVDDTSSGKAPRLETYEEGIVSGYDPDCTELFDIVTMLPSGDVVPIWSEVPDSYYELIDTCPASEPIASSAFTDAPPAFIIDPAIPLVQQGRQADATAAVSAKSTPAAVPSGFMNSRTTAVFPIDWLAAFEEMAAMLPDRFGDGPGVGSEPATLAEKMSVLERAGILGPPTPYRFVVDKMDREAIARQRHVTASARTSTTPIRSRSFRDLITDLRDLHAELIAVRSEIDCWTDEVAYCENPPADVSYSDAGQAVLASYVGEVETIQPIRKQTQRETIVRTKDAPSSVTRPERRPTMSMKVKTDKSEKSDKTNKSKRDQSRKRGPAEPDNKHRFDRMSQSDLGVEDLLDVLSIASNEMACLRAAEFDAVPPQAVIDWSEADWVNEPVASDAGYDVTSGNDQMRKEGRRRFHRSRSGRPIAPTRN